MLRNTLFSIFIPCYIIIFYGGSNDYVCEITRLIRAHAHQNALINYYSYLPMQLVVHRAYHIRICMEKNLHALTSTQKWTLTNTYSNFLITIHVSVSTETI